MLISEYFQEIESQISNCIYIDFVFHPDEEHRGQVFILDKRDFSVAKRGVGSRLSEMRCAVVSELHRAGKDAQEITKIN